MPKVRKILEAIDGSACIIAYKGHIYPPNPLTTILAVVPFIPFRALVHDMADHETLKLRS